MAGAGCISYPQGKAFISIGEEEGARRGRRKKLRRRREGSGKGKEEGTYFNTYEGNSSKAFR